MGRTIGLLAGAGAVVAVGLLVALGLFQPDGPQDVTGSDSGVTSDAVSNLASDPAEPAGAGPAADPAQPTGPQAAAAPGTPRIGTLRIEADGMALVSGQTDPDARVEIMLGEDVVAKGVSASDGSFLIFGMVPDNAKAGALVLRSTGADGTMRLGTQTFIVEPPRPQLARQIALADEDPGPSDTMPATSAADAGRTNPQAEAGVALDKASELTSDLAALEPQGAGALDGSVPAQTASAAASDDATDPAQVAAAQPDAAAPDPSNSASQTTAAAQTQNTPAPRDVTTVAPQPLTLPRMTGGSGDRPTQTAGSLVGVATQAPRAPRVLRVEAGGLSVVQGGPAAALSIDSISYGTDGRAVLGGRAPDDTGLRVYLDNTPVDAARSGPDGQWRLDLPRLEEQVYTLRVDQIAADGSVVARAETPFKPEDAETLDAFAATEQDGVRRITVQPGFTLWAIAERNYGDGLAYVKVFEANAADIRDPDLIYPGQIFDVPDGAAAQDAAAQDAAENAAE